MYSSTIHARLTEARQARFPTAAEFARFAKVSLQTYFCHESGTRGVKWAVAKRYAELLDVDFLWLWTGIKAAPETYALPIKKFHQLTSLQLTELKINSTVEVDEILSIPYSSIAVKISDRIFHSIDKKNSYVMVNIRDKLLKSESYYLALYLDIPSLLVYKQTPANKYFHHIGSSEIIPHKDSDVVILGRVTHLISPL